MYLSKDEEEKIGSAGGRSSGGTSCRGCSGTRLLIVDDEAAFLKLLVVMLRLECPARRLRIAQRH